MDIKSIENFKLSDLKYDFNDDNRFIHNYNRDLHFVLLWENGRSKENKIIDKIESEYDIKYCVEIIWSNEYKRANFNRLYSQQIDSKLNLKKHKKVGMGEFLCIVFEDPNPNYQYLKSLSGEVFIGNKNVVDTKYEIRNILGDNLLHGTASISEFFHHGILIFHEELLNHILSISTWDNEVHRMKQDMAGATGWKSFSEFFKAMNYSSNWLVLRNHEFLPDDFWGNDKDIDLMCDNIKKFVSASNANKRRGGLSAYETIVEGQKVLLDIRYVGDNYYNSVWESDMLARKQYKSGYVPILRTDDYFFSLLYHAKLQKRTVKDVYISRLIKLGNQIGLRNISKSTILNDKIAISILNGFLNERGYYFTLPYDKRVYLNKNSFKFINAHPLIVKESIKSKIIKFISRVFPSPVKRLVPHKLKRLITKRVN